MKRKVIVIVLCFIAFSASSQVSPWGTGLINDQLIGDVQNTAVIFPSQSGYGNFGFYPDPNSLLPTYTFDFYIPDSYDGTEPYGLVTYINSGNNGGIPSSWLTVLDEKKLIMVAGDNIGNPINIDIRMGVAMAAVYRLREVLNIDDSRIYTSGQSGGGRMAGLLALTYPEWFYGALPNCGCSYLRTVDQDYETQNPNSNYEYILPFTASYLDYAKTFDRRYAIQTSYDDFREGDIMNIYHNGMEEDGFKGKFLEKSGGHCSTNAAHFRDAVNFVEHPHIHVVNDDFTMVSQIGDGFEKTSSTIFGQQLVLDHAVANRASAYSRNPFAWNDEKGGILRTSIVLDPTEYNQNSFVNIGLLDYSDTSVFEEVIGHELYTGKANFIVNILFDDSQPTVHLLAENPSASISNDTLFTGTFSDWSVDTVLNIKMHVWNQEVRVEFSNHFDPNAITEGNMVTFLDDNRSIQIRTNNTYWGASDFIDGTLLTLVSGKLDTTIAASVAKIDMVEVIAASNNIPSVFVNTAHLDEDEQVEFRVFPNPSNGKFTISSTIEGDVRMKILSLEGKLIRSHNHVGSQSEIDLTGIESGVYLLQSERSLNCLKLMIR